MGMKEKYGEYGVVLGASMGIGAGVARGLAANGMNVVLVARSVDKLEALAKELTEKYGVDARALPIDLLEADAWDKLDVGLEGFDVGVAVYSAAYAHVGGLLACPDDLEDRIMRLNVYGSLNFAKYFGNRFCRQRRGGMLFLGSASGLYSTPFMALYSATKGFEIALGESLYGEFKNYNVDVTTAIIGSVDTPGLHYLYPDEKQFAAMKPGDPDVVGKACVDAIGTGPTAFPIKDDYKGMSMMRKFMSMNKQIDVIDENILKLTFQGKFPSEFPDE